MTKLEFTKMAVNIVVGAGTSKIVGSIIRNNATPANLADQVTMTAGAVVLGSMAADASKKYTGDKIDEMASWWNENVKKN